MGRISRARYDGQPGMKIDRIDLWHVAVPLPAPFRPSWIPGFVQTENRFDLLRIRTASGAEGWSAAPAVGTERKGLGALLGPYLLGERADDIENVRQRIREMGYLGHRVGFLEAACWDAMGRARGKPVYELLGGSPGSVRLYASSGEIRSVSDRIAAVEERLAEGFEAVKLRVHADTVEEDIGLIRGVRQGVDADVAFMVDANQGWRVAAIADAPCWDLERARAFCSAAGDLGFKWVEEPLAHDDYAALATLRSEGLVSIAGGELNSQGLPEFGVMLEKKCYDVYQPDAVFTGGISGTRDIVARIEAAGERYSPHTWTNGIGFAINLHVFAASSRREDILLEYPLDPPGWVAEGRDGLLQEPLVSHPGRPGATEEPLAWVFRSIQGSCADTVIASSPRPSCGSRCGRLPSGASRWRGSWVGSERRPPPPRRSRELDERSS